MIQVQDIILIYGHCPMFKITKYDEQIRHYSHVGITQYVSLLQKMIHDALLRYHAQIAEVLQN